MRICIAICTAGRPRMLRACLLSIFRQELPQGATVSILVVDNNPDREAESLVAGLQAESPVPLLHVHEPIQGIPFARNRALDAALELGSDWIVFIDDDEEAQAGWLTGLMDAAHRYEADVVQGRREKIYPEPLPPFVYPKQHPHRPDGAVLSTAWTHNVAFASWLVKLGQGGLRFDEEMRYTGGTDTLFFRQARQLGAHIVATPASIVTEIQPVERLGLGWQLKRERRTGASDIEALRRSGLLTDGRWRQERSKALKRLGAASLRVIAAPLYLLSGWQQFQRRTVLNLMTAARSIGTLNGLRGRMDEPYRMLDGH